MAIIGAITKQPREILPIDLDYGDFIGSRTADSITPSIEVPTGMTLSSQQVAGQVLQIYIAGGTTGTAYKWTVLTDIMIGGHLCRLEDEFNVLVEET
jgi:hypothetical protein